MTESEQDALAEKIAAKIKRPTLAQMAMGGNQDGWICPGCGCQDWRVIRSGIGADGNRRRQRVCRKCKRPISTVELPVEG